MKIPVELTPIAYQVAKQVFEGKITFKVGQMELVGQGRMNKNSAADYINNFRMMVEGKRFTRTNNAYSMAYFFDHLYQDYGAKVLSDALNALKLHIEYYEGIQKVTMHKMRGIHEKYSIVRMESPDEFEQQEIIKEFKRQNKSREDIIKELKSLNLNEPEIVKVSTKTYKRDNRTIAQIKILRDFKCQICQNTIKKKDGTYYIEAAHIEPKHKKGVESADNIVLLCPNHHKEFDLGELVIILHNKEAFHFILNGQEYVLSLKIE